jgi:soluble lytic murein transglycosylase-like protein
MTRRAISPSMPPALRQLAVSCALLSASLGGAHAQAVGSAWIDPSEQNKTIYPAPANGLRQAHEPSVRMQAQRLVEDGTKLIWPKTLTASEQTALAHRLLPKAFTPDMASASASAPQRGAASRATPLMLKTLMQAAERFSVDAYLIKAVIHAESAFNPRARSPKNAIGLMQVLPGTARDLGLSAQPTATVEELLTDPRVSIVVGTKYLAEQLERFGGNVELAVAAYNAGPGAVMKAGNKVPPYAETRAYVKRVMELARNYRLRKTLQGVQA